MKIDSKSLPFTRNVAKRTKRVGRAYVMCSPKNGFMEIRMESRLEQAIAQSLELDPRVRRYRSQPFTLNLATNELLTEIPKRKPEGAVYYTPDLVCELADVVVVIEAKPLAFVSKNEELFERVRACLLKHGMRFVVLSEDAFAGHTTRNIELLMQYQTQARDALPSLAEPLMQRVPQDLIGHVSQVMATLSPANHHVAAGLLLGVIQFDLAAHLFEKMDFTLAPAYGSLLAFEVLNYG